MTKFWHLACSYGEMLQDLQHLRDAKISSTCQELKQKILQRTRLIVKSRPLKYYMRKLVSFFFKKKVRVIYRLLITHLYFAKRILSGHKLGKEFLSSY